MSRARLGSCGLMLLALLAAGCGGSSSSSTTSGSTGSTSGGTQYPAQPLLTATGDSGKVKLELRSAPQPPTRGVNSMQLVLRDANGDPLEGVGVAAQPWMVDMAHGSSVMPTVTEKGGGIYELTDVYLAMPGTWQLRLTFTGKVDDHAAPQLQIP